MEINKPDEPQVSPQVQSKLKFPCTIIYGNFSFAT